MKISTKTLFFMATFLSIQSLQASHFLSLTDVDDSIHQPIETFEYENNIGDDKIETVLLEANKGDCYNCTERNYTFSGKDISYIRLYDDKMKCKELNSSIPNGQMTYSFKREGTYYMEFNYKDGHIELKKIIVSFE